MQRPIVEYADARNMMVDGQVRPNRVSDRRILDAMRRLPRERFVPPARVAMAYSDADIPLGNGRVMLEPMVIARLVQLADVKQGERVLVVGSNTGYGAALLAACGAAVTALEPDPSVVAIAREALRDVSGVTLVSGPLPEGWAAGAPYDAMLIEGGAAKVPATLAEQLRPAGARAEPVGPRAGRLVAILTAGPHIGRAVLGERVGSGVGFQPAFDCAAATLPGLAREAGFVF